MASRQFILAMELEDTEREKFDGSLAKRQILPPSINCAIQYIASILHVYRGVWSCPTNAYFARTHCKDSLAEQKIELLWRALRFKRGHGAFAPPPSSTAYES